MERIDAPRGMQGANVIEGDQAGVEEGIELGREQEAVEDIETFDVVGAVGPWPGVAGAEKWRWRMAKVRTVVAEDRPSPERLARRLMSRPCA